MFNECLRGLRTNTDDTMRTAADATWDLLETMPHSDYIVPEKTPDETALGNGRTVDQSHIQQFGSGSIARELESERVNEHANVD